MGKNKIAVVTGANRGLGLGTAKDLAERGFVVFMVGRDSAAITAAAAEVGKLGQTRAVVGDVTQVTDAQKLAALIQKEFGHLDILINNAGVFLEGSRKPEASSVFETSPDTVLQTFEINTLGPLKMIQALAPLLRKSAAGRIVNVSSGMGQLSDMSGSYTGYRLSKSALNALTRIAAAEFAGTSVKVNSVCPGWVKTDMGGAGADRPIPQGVASIVWAALIDNKGPTGGFFRDGEKLDW
jgi:NAD(P)-dependent dehydrogenase (short-subunit alcohol dehydrogenase family)